MTDTIEATHTTGGDTHAARADRAGATDDRWPLITRRPRSEEVGEPFREFGDWWSTIGDGDRAHRRA
ncbi:MAG TPA: hypothetical protein VFO77_09470, partial [Actinoplanes sp.]|nr:hypothetical protein [Actinoplanes sp.]